MVARVTAAGEGPRALLPVLWTDSQRAAPGREPAQPGLGSVLSSCGTEGCTLSSFVYVLSSQSMFSFLFYRFKVRLRKVFLILALRNAQAYFLFVCYCLNSIKIFFWFNDSSPEAIQLHKTVTGQ